MATVKTLASDQVAAVEVELRRLFPADMGAAAMACIVIFLKIMETQDLSREEIADAAYDAVMSFEQTKQPPQ